MNPSEICLSSGRYNLGAVAANDGRIYAFGGFATGFSYTDIVEAYDPFNNTWSRAPSMIVRREAPGAALGLDGRIYAIGGTVSDYDRLHGEWVNKFMNTGEVFIP
jgi:N-acetylneuraminic acid mutarotase